MICLSSDRDFHFLWHVRLIGSPQISQMSADKKLSAGVCVICGLFLRSGFCLIDCKLKIEFQWTKLRRYVAVFLPALMNLRGFPRIEPK
jgi:hypothetical protein